MYENENITNTVGDDDVLLPEGWGEGDDIFSEGGWTGNGRADAPAAGTPGQEPEGAVGASAEAPATEPAIPGEQAADERAPATEPVQQMPNRLKFKARVDRQDLDVEVDESEVPTLYEKAQATDRYKAKATAQAARIEQAERVVKAMGYDDLDAFLANAGDNYQRSEVRRLVGEGVHEEVARDMVARRFVPQQNGAPATEPQPAADVEKTPARDFSAEVAMLKAARPDLMGKQLPVEVIRACTDGKNPKHLMVAYAEYELAQQKAEAEKLRKENEVLKQNAAAAARAPVSGVSGGGATNTVPDDDFMKGFGKGW